MKTFINNDVAIVLAVEKEKYEDRLSGLFKDVGVFIYKDNEPLENTNFTEVNVNTFDKIYYSKREFLNTSVKYKNGDELSFEDKYEFFKKMYKGIVINKEPR
ncbi:hypothetical protein RBH29_13455, partial [Herbivorax sp. ANBcel31]|uniref:hypothetical protein n=1 Tax=Herbivorax sp. ANBcel31 TaxID=3069754 RepID=UPI0027B7177C